MKTLACLTCLAMMWFPAPSCADTIDDIADLQRALADLKSTQLARLDPHEDHTTATDHRYEWRLTPGGQHALMCDDKQIGNWNHDKGGYFPYLGAGKWGPKTLLPMGVRQPDKPPPPPAIPKEVWPVASPFVRGWPLQSARHDADLDATGPWPEGLEFPAGMRRYRRAAYTQEIAVTDGRDRITPVHRLNVKSKWHQSGGLEGVDGWRSDLYRSAHIPRAYVGNVAVWNGSNFQDNRGWKREYPEGATFMDVLSAKGKVFEVRRFEKSDSKWRPSTLFSDVEARPVGYTGLTVSCSSCHSEAGTGGYATGLVPGGDNVLSDPFPQLER